MLKWEAGSIRKWEVAVTVPARPVDNNSKARKSQANRKLRWNALGKTHRLKDKSIHLRD